MSPSLIVQNIIYGINQEEYYEDALEYYLTKSVDLCKAKSGNNFY